MTGRTVRAAKIGHRIALDIFYGIRAGLDIPIVAGIAAGLTTFLWLSLLLPGGALR